MARRSPNYGKRHHRSIGPEVYLVGRVERDGETVLQFEGPRIAPFEMPAGDHRRGIFRTELLKAGVFRLPRHLFR